LYIPVSGFAPRQSLISRAGFISFLEKLEPLSTGKVSRNFRGKGGELPRAVYNAAILGALDKNAILKTGF
jgi:hypothetical protein